MINIQPQYLSLAKLLDRRLFRIPEYQRAYSWGKNQRLDLFADISRAHSKGADSGHFMAAIVGLLRGKQTLDTDVFEVLEIVDGQQRITTLVILFRAIQKALVKAGAKDSKFGKELSDMLVKSTEDLLLLQTNHDTSHYFAGYMRTGIAPASATAATLADKELLRAIEDCEEFVENWHGEPTELGALLKNQLFFLLHQIDDEKAVYTVFEVLNSRGLAVSWFDRLKSILMGAAFELEGIDNSQLIKDLHVIWQDIYRIVGLRQGLNTESLRFAATLWQTPRPNKPLGEEISVGLLRSKCQSAKSIRDTANWLLQVTEQCDLLHANKRLSAATQIVQARLLAVAIGLHEGLSQIEKNRLLQHWEVVTFRIYGLMRNDARTSVGHYVRTAWWIVADKPTAKEIHASLKELGDEFPIDKAVDRLLEENCYDGWEQELRYFMYRYEEHLDREQVGKISEDQWAKIWMHSPNESIEHISPQSAGSGYRHRIGNLLLLTPGLNSKLNAKPPTEKAKAYRETGLLEALEVGAGIEKEGWDDESIKNRTVHLAEWAGRQWADPEF